MKRKMKTVTNRDAYTIIFTEGKKLTINKADSSVTKAPTPKTGLKASSTPMELVNAGETSAGSTMQYSLDGTNFSLDIPKATSAGDYTVYYKAVGDKNHNDSEVAGPVNVTIDSSGGGGGGGSGGGGGGGGGATTYNVTVASVSNGSASANPTKAAAKATVTITPTPAATYMVDSVTAKDAKGNDITVSAGSNGKYTFTMPASNVTVTPLAASRFWLPIGPQYTPAPTAHWTYSVAQLLTVLVSV